jgi:hypothetical protein
MSRLNGYAFLTDRSSGNIIAEADTFRCNHCGYQTHVKAKQRPEDIGGFCTVCSGLICVRCLGKGCDTLEARIERAEAAYEARRSYGMI